MRISTVPGRSKLEGHLTLDELEQNIERELYLAIPRRSYQTIFQSELGRILLQKRLMRLLVFDEIQEVSAEWIPD